MAEKEKKKKRLSRKDLAFLLCLLLVAAIFRSEVVQAVTVAQSSMEPTLHGGPDVEDVVLLNKLAYKLADPQRWDVVVFGRPGWSGDPYIKRLVGRPDEELLIKNGDIYINGSVAAKPEDVQSTLWLPVYTGGPESREPLSKAWRRTSTGSVRSDNSGFEARSRSGAVLAGMQFRAKVVDRARPNNNKVADLKLEFDVTVLAADTVVVAEFLDNHVPYSFAVRVVARPQAGLGENRAVPGAAGISINGRTVERTSDVQLEVGKSYRFACSRLDGTLTLRVDHKTLLEVSENRVAATVRDTTSSGARLGVRSGHARIENIRLYRDIYYTSNSDNGRFGTARPFHVPPGQYFFLGDNSANSQDSRTWGSVPRAKLTGKAIFIFNRFKTL